MLIPWKENGRRTGPRGEKSSTGLNLGKIKVNKSLNSPSYEYSTIFQIDRQIFPAFCPQIRALGGEIVPVQKNFRNMSHKSY